ncbi:MAG TPA: tripartite tricarboxylate transporter substrate binding protein [Rhodocyclaceae bacterium]|nr:tripartite tricarboxylate transporter substrate binding protein [Rhodocyclaceae bacterium]
MKSMLGKALAGVIGAGMLASVSTSALAAWEPDKQVEFVVPAGTGGGADQMARLMQGIIVKYNLMKQPLVVVNKSGGAGAEGFLAIKNSKGDPYHIVITLSNLFTTPLATGVPFNWKDMTPVEMLALDQFILWVNAEKPYKTAKEFIDAAKAAGPGKFKMGGTGSKQEDQIVTAGLEKATGTKFAYIPYKGGGEVAVQLVGNHIDATVNNPAEAVAQWRAGTLRPLCVFDDVRLPYKTKVTSTQAWNDIPTCKEAGIPTDYQMLRGIFMPPGVTQDQVAYFIGVFKKMMETPDWKDYMEKGAFSQTVLSGKEFSDWLGKAEANHKQLMTESGFLAK